MHYLYCGFTTCAVTLAGSYDLGLCGGFTSSYVCKVDIGDNHGGYIGFRDSNNINQLKDDGAINIVVKNWKNP
ncbi:MAG TPA: hypothetical protein VFH25_08575 [Nitrososphaeraceae archaeon]|nr:hypothetical protein [Nitrososphaeraceae archaeon]